MKNWRIGLLGVAVSAAVIIFIVRELDAENLSSALRTARYSYVIPCIVLLVAGLITRAARWRTLLGESLPIYRAFSIMNVAYLVNGILPMRIGEVARVFLATRVSPPIPVMKTTSTIIAERLLDLMAVILMALMALAVAPLPDQIQTTSAILGPLAVIGFGVLIILAWQRERTLRITQRFIQNDRLIGWLTHFLSGLSPLTQPISLAKAVSLTVVSWGLSACAGYVLMFAFYDQASWATTFLYIAWAAFAIALPAVPGNLGTYELAILGALEATGYPVYVGDELVVTAVWFAVMVHGVNLFVHAATGALGLLQEGISLQQLSRGVNQMQRIGHQEAS